MKVFVHGQGPVTLEPGDFVGQGGQACVYARGDVAFKLFADPNAMVSYGKLLELRAISHPDVIVPDALVKDDKSGRAIGYTMRYVRGARPLGQLFPPAFQQRHRLDAAAVLGLVEKLRELFVAVHEGGALVVDANELNFLIDADFKRVYAIDTDSYATRSYPASAIAPTIRDPRTVPTSGGAPTFDEGSDWFAFAVLAFQLWVGMHPYRGTHPTARTLSERMRANLSAFDPTVKLPPMAAPFDTLPGPLREFLEATLQRGERSAPPSFDVAPASAYPKQGRHVAAPLAVGPKDGLRLEVLARAPGAIVRIFAGETNEVLLDGAEGLTTLEGRALPEVPRGRHAIAFSPRLGRPVVATETSQGVTLTCLTSGLRLEAPGKLEAIALGGGRLVARMGDALVELGLREVGATVIVTPKVLARVLPRATQLFDGVAVQSLLGATYLSLFGGPNGCRQLRVPELDGTRVLDAICDRSVVALVVEARGVWQRVRLRVSATDGSYDVRVTHGIEPEVCELVVLETGVGLMRTDANGLEVFSAAPHSLTRKSFDDARLADMRLARSAGSVLAFRGDVVYRLTSQA